MQVRIDADGLDFSASAMSGLIDRIRLGDQPNTIVLDTNGTARATVTTANNVARVLIEVAAAATSESRAPGPAPAPAPTPVPSAPIPDPRAVIAATRTWQTIVIDPGHGGDDVGVRSAKGVEEKQLTLDIARRLRAMVESRLWVISPTVLQWTGASPWMDLVQRALIWEAREPDVYVNIFFGFPFADVPDVGMTVQVLTNGNPELAERVAQDMAGTIWRQRRALLSSTKIHAIAEGVTLAKRAVEDGKTPVVLADHSDRSGSATWLLREIVRQGLANTLIATIADAEATAKLKAMGAEAGDRFDMEIGGLVDESAGEPIHIQGTVLSAVESHGQFWVCIQFGHNNVLILSTYLVQIMEPFSLKALGLDIDAFEVMAIKSRVHFRRGFDDNGFAKTILLVEPEQPFLGTTRLDELPYENVDLMQYYPYGNPAFPA